MDPTQIRRKLKYGLFPQILGNPYLYGVSNLATFPFDSDKPFKVLVNLYNG
jgi:hypothetical protein